MSIKENTCNINTTDNKIISTTRDLFLFVILPFLVIRLYGVSTGAKIIISIKDTVATIIILKRLAEINSAISIPNIHIMKVNMKHLQEVSAW